MIADHPSTTTRHQLFPNSSRSSPIAIFDKLFSKASGQTAQPEIYVGVFGKHPGWDDHIDDLGLETERLVSIKQVMYREGLAANIDSGAWEKLDDAQRIDGFSHHFAWWISNASSSDLTVGRMWTSSDGKGRTKYPMVICAQCKGVGVEWPFLTALPLISDAERLCKAAATAREVIQIIDQLRTDLRARARSAPNANTFDPQTIGGSGGLADALAFPSNPSFARAMYAIDRECAAFTIPTSGSRWGAVTPLAAPESRSSLSLRLPIPTQWEPNAPQCIQHWLTALFNKLDPGTPMLLIKPEAGNWVDALIGEPNSAQFFVLRAGAQAMPPVSEVPYTLDAVFLQEVERLVNDSKSMRPMTLDQPKRRSFSAPSGRLRAPVLASTLAVAAGLACQHNHVIAAQSAPAPAIEPLRQDSRDRYNQLLRELKAAVERPNTSDEVSRAAVQRFITSATELPGGIVFLRETDELISGLKRVLAQSGGARQADADATRAGPGSIPGVTPAALMDGRVRFTLPGGRSGEELFIEFARVEPTGPSSNVWISTTEVSARLFSETISTLGSWEQIRKIMHTFGLEEDERLGPRVWRWTFGKKPGTTMLAINGLAPSAQWLVRSERAGAGEVYAKDVNPGVPTLEMPMQHISPDAAIYAASLVGCRLPTSAEWLAAQRTFASNTPPSALNLRDLTWSRQQQHVESQIAAGRRAWAADAGSFVWVDAPPVPKGPKSTQVTDSNDGVLWFQPVGVGGGAMADQPGSAPLVKHLVGNVAEWVWDGPDVGSGRDAAEIQRAIEAQSDRLGVIGGSALSAPGIPAQTLQKALLAEAREGYADVGFRLAFTVGPAIGSTVADRVNALLTPLPTIGQTP